MKSARHVAARNHLHQLHSRWTCMYTWILVISRDGPPYHLMVPQPPNPHPSPNIYAMCGTFRCASCPIHTVHRASAMWLRSWHPPNKGHATTNIFARPQFQLTEATGRRHLAGKGAQLAAQTRWVVSCASLSHEILIFVTSTLPS